MKAVLKDNVVNGQRWRAGSKKREELIRDYRALLGLSPEVESPAAAAAAEAAVSMSAPAASGTVHQGQLSARGDGPTRSRILEHTASRCGTLGTPRAPLPAGWGLSCDQRGTWDGAGGHAAQAPCRPAMMHACMLCSSHGSMAECLN